MRISAKSNEICALLINSLWYKNFVDLKKMTQNAPILIIGGIDTSANDSLTI